MLETTVATLPVGTNQTAHPTPGTSTNPTPTPSRRGRRRNRTANDARSQNTQRPSTRSTERQQRNNPDAAYNSEDDFVTELWIVPDFLQCLSMNLLTSWTKVLHRATNWMIYLLLSFFTAPSFIEPIFFNLQWEPWHFMLSKWNSCLPMSNNLFSVSVVTFQPYTKENIAYEFFLFTFFILHLRFTNRILSFAMSAINQK